MVIVSLNFIDKNPKVMAMALRTQWSNELKQYKRHLKMAKKAVDESGLYSNAVYAFNFSSFSNPQYLDTKSFQGSAVGALGSIHNYMERKSAKKYLQLKREHENIMQNAQKYDSILLFVYNYMSDTSYGWLMASAFSLTIIPYWATSNTVSKLIIIDKKTINLLMENKTLDYSSMVQFMTMRKIKFVLNIVFLPVVPFTCWVPFWLSNKVIYNSTMNLLEQAVGANKL